MLVDRSNFAVEFPQLVKAARAEKFVALDTETTALFWWNSPHYAIRPRVFSIQFSTADCDWYFDFGCEESANPLGEGHFHEIQRELFSDADITWFVHNFKFDAHHLWNHKLMIFGTWHCTQSIQRVVNNLEGDDYGKGLNLDALAEKYLGANKIDLSEYWKDARRVTKVKRPGENGKFYDFLHFDRLPLAILVEYGCRDTRLCYRLGRYQLAEIEKQNQRYFAAVPSNFGGSLYRVLENERQLTKTLFHMERQGVKLDMDYVRAAQAHAIDGIKSALSFLDPIAQPFLDSLPDGEDKPVKMDWESGVMLQGLFTHLGLPYSYTQKGNASFDKDALEKLDHEVAKKILEYRRHSKRAHTYLENYLWLADEDGVLHCNFAQGGPRTGRMSSREPNLQNVPKRSDKQEKDFPLRRCFIPRPGKILVSKDWDQVEYRMMLDYAREMALIDRILKDGLDVHDATDKELELGDRDDAKTMNFMLLYGGGVPKLAAALYDTSVPMEALKAIWMLYKWPNWKGRDGYMRDKELIAALPAGEHLKNLALIKKAEAKMNLYFEKLPKVKEFVTNVKDKAKKQKVIFTWLGRVGQFGRDADGNSTDYKAPNWLIQGGAGDASKVGMNRVHAFLTERSTTSCLILQVHDEFVSEIDANETHLIPELLKIMESCYPHRLIPLTAGCAWSEKSWGDLKDGLP